MTAAAVLVAGLRRPVALPTALVGCQQATPPVARAAVVPELRLGLARPAVALILDRPLVDGCDGTREV